ncbi:MAG: ABC transporter permease [Aggregatilineales bacterium]
MSMQTEKSKISEQQKQPVFTRIRLIGGLLLLLGAFIFLTGNTIDPETTSTLLLEAGEIEEVPHITIPTLFFVMLTAVLAVAGGSAAMVVTDSASPMLKNTRNVLITLAGLIFVPAVLSAAVAGSSTNITVLIAESIRLATPLAIGAMAGIWCERAGVINIAIEGMMLWAACFGFTTMFTLNSMFPDNIAVIQVIAVLVAIFSAGIFSLLHAWLSITFRTDQIISGTVLNIMALGATSFIRREYLLGNSGGLARLPEIPIPVLSDIPILGDALFSGQPIFYMMFVIIILTHVMLFYTRWGLRIRAVGENPHAADTLGIKVNRSRWINVFISGMIAGLAGAWFSLEATGTFNDNMTAGAGFIALAAVIFGKWYPFGAFGAALLFGFSQAFGTSLQIIGVNFPVQFLQMLPFVVTIFVLAGFIGRANPPKASGQPYVKE